MFTVPAEILAQTPDWNHPTGPVWKLSGPSLGLDSEHGYLVRELIEGHSMLRVAAVLGRAANLELPNLRPVGHWNREGEKTWIATRCDVQGDPLSTHRDRMDWSQAVELWRPLVLAIQKSHRRGVIHGSLCPTSVWLDAAAVRLVAFDSGTWIGDLRPAGVWWPETTIHGDVANLARLLIWLFHPSEAEASTPNMKSVPAYAIPALLRALDPSNQTNTQDLLAALAPAPMHAPQISQSEDHETVLYGRVHGVEHVENARLGRGIKFWITYPQYDSSGQALGFGPPRGAFFYETAHGGVYESVRHVWDGAELNLIDARVVKDSSGQPFLTASNDTLPVLEPHWPVPVTNVLKAQGCVSKYFVDLRDSGPPGRPLVLGNLVHGFLEDLAGVEQAPPFEDLWRARAPRLRVAMLLAGINDRALPKFREDAQKHYDGILAFARSRSGGDERVGWSGDQAEVSRYSSIYGLEGRIDLVTEDEKTGLHIVELKTGRVRDDHVSQLSCYRLLWDDLTDQRRIEVSGYLLYSRDAQLRAAAFDPVRDRRLLRARNNLVATHHRLAFSDDFELPYFMQTPANCRNNDCRFRKDRCATQTRVLGLGQTAGDADENGLAHYWRHFSRLLEVENWVEHEQIGAMLQPDRVNERVSRHRAMTNLILVEIHAETQALVFEGVQSRTFNVGDRVIAHRGDFHNDHIMKARVDGLEGGRITLRTPAAPMGGKLPKHGWTLDRVPMRIGYRAGQQSLFRALHAQDDDLVEILLRPFGEGAERLMTGDRGARLGESATSVLNAAQLEAVATAVSSPKGCLIQGPPGTGKTTVIAHAVKELVAQGRRVLVAAQTHTAVDTMLNRLLELPDAPPFLRVGEPRRSPRLNDKLLELGLRPSDVFTDSLQESAQSLDVLHGRLSGAMVVGCTTYAASRSDIINLMTQDSRFDTVIIDEATQITEPMTLAPISRAGRFVLVGDHRQLSPIVQSELANSIVVDGWDFGDSDSTQPGLFDAPAPPGPGLRGLDQSLFERLANSGCPYVMLTEQYRMNRAIVAFSNAQFYNGRLACAPIAASRQLEVSSQEGAFSEVLTPEHPVVFVDVDGASKDGRTNEAEVDAVAAIVGELRRLAPTSTVGVVTPFRAQVNAIRRRLDGLNVDVDTVERYQGSERDTIVVSTVKTDGTGEFLADPKRLNVTLTRARTKLIIVGKRDCLEDDPMFRALIEQPETKVVPWNG